MVDSADRLRAWLDTPELACPYEDILAVLDTFAAALARAEQAEREHVAILTRAAQAQCELLQACAHAQKCAAEAQATAARAIERAHDMEDARDQAVARMAEMMAERDAALARAERAERTAAEATRRLEEVLRGKSHKALVAWQLDQPPDGWRASSDYLALKCYGFSAFLRELLDCLADEPTEATRAWAEGHAEPAAPVLDPADVLPLVRAALEWHAALTSDQGRQSDADDALAAAVDAVDDAVGPPADAVEALPPAWREAAKGGGQ